MYLLVISEGIQLNTVYILQCLLSEGQKELPWPSEQKVHGSNMVNVICGVKKGIQPLYVSIIH